MTRAHFTGSVLACDPGVGLGKFSGWALLEDAMLQECGVIEGYGLLGTGIVDHINDLAKILRHRGVDIVAVEQMVERGKSSNVRAKDLLALSQVSGAMLALPGAGERRLVPPSTWKGSTPKPIANQRTLDALTGAEVQILNAVTADMKTIPHDLLDAIGIGLHVVGRGFK